METVYTYLSNYSDRPLTHNSVAFQLRAVTHDSSSVPPSINRRIEPAGPEEMIDPLLFE